MSNTLLHPDGWLVLGLPWPEQTQDGWGECALAIAPQTIPRSLVSKGAGTALDLATGLARDPADGPGKAVFFSDLTLWLDKQGKAWGDLGIDYETVIDELVKARWYCRFPSSCRVGSTKEVRICLTSSARSGLGRRKP